MHVRREEERRGGALARSRPPAIPKTISVECGVPPTQPSRRSPPEKPSLEKLRESAGRRCEAPSSCQVAAFRPTSTGGDWQTETANGLSSTPSTNLSRDKPPEEPPVAGKQTNSSPSEQRNISKVPTSQIFSHQRRRATSKTFPILRTIDLGDRTLPQSLEKPPPEPSKVTAASHCSRVRCARLLQSLPANSENP